VLFANVITALETYLSDRFLNQVLADPTALRKFIESAPEFKKRVVPYSEVFNSVDKAREEAKRYLLDVVWHNVAKAQALYRDTFGIRFPAPFAEIAGAIPKRHDIVHRNGRNVEGAKVVVTVDDVRALSTAVSALAEKIDEGSRSVTGTWPRRGYVAAGMKRSAPCPGGRSASGRRPRASKPRPSSGPRAPVLDVTYRGHSRLRRRVGQKGRIVGNER